MYVLRLYVCMYVCMYVCRLNTLDITHQDLSAILRGMFDRLFLFGWLVGWLVGWYWLISLPA